MEILYILLIISVLCPVYTYVIYPLILKMLPLKKFEKKEITPFVTVIITKTQKSSLVNKIDNLKRNGYYKLEIMTIESDIKFNEAVKKAQGEIIIFTNDITEYSYGAIAKLVNSFADDKVGCVVGQQSSKTNNSIFWKYENAIKRQESKIGSVSGANDSIYAIRKELIPIVPRRIINRSFYLSTYVTQSGYNVVYEGEAVAYETNLLVNAHNKHVEDAKGYYQALRIFWRLLLFRKGSFVYVSHRVMKYFVWLNMLIFFVISGILSFIDISMLFLFVGQIIVYLVLVLSKNSSGIIGRVLSVGQYFLKLNWAYFVALIKK